MQKILGAEKIFLSSTPSRLYFNLKVEDIIFRLILCLREALSESSNNAKNPDLQIQECDKKEKIKSWSDEMDNENKMKRPRKRSSKEWSSKYAIWNIT